ADGEVRCISHRPDDALDQIEILQAARAAVVFDDLLDRAAEVDVDEVGPAGLGDHLGGTGHDCRVCAIQLNPDGALRLLRPHDGGQVLEAAGHADGRDEFRHADVRPKAPDRKSGVYGKQ